MAEDGRIVPVRNNLNIVARGGDIIGWYCDDSVRPIYDTQKRLIKKDIETRSDTRISMREAIELGVLQAFPGPPEAIRINSSSPPNEVRRGQQ